MRGPQFATETRDDRECIIAARVERTTRSRPTPVAGTANLLRSSSPAAARGAPVGLPSPTSANRSSGVEVTADPYGTKPRQAPCGYWTGVALTRFDAGIGSSLARHRLRPASATPAGPVASTGQRSRSTVRTAARLRGSTAARVSTLADSLLSGRPAPERATVAVAARRLPTARGGCRIVAPRATSDNDGAAGPRSPGDPLAVRPIWTHIYHL